MCCNAERVRRIHKRYKTYCYPSLVYCQICASPCKHAVARHPNSSDKSTIWWSWHFRKPAIGPALLLYSGSLYNAIHPMMPTFTLVFVPYALWVQHCQIAVVVYTRQCTPNCTEARQINRPFGDILIQSNGVVDHLLYSGVPLCPFSTAARLQIHSITQISTFIWSIIDLVIHLVSVTVKPTVGAAQTIQKFMTTNDR